LSSRLSASENYKPWLQGLEPIVAWLQHVRASPAGKQRRQAAALHDDRNAQVS
jgi:hypothetical protein